MDENIHVTEGKPSGGKTGAVISGIIVAIVMNVGILQQFYGVDTVPTVVRVIFAILSVFCIPIAVFGQNISRKIFDLIHRLHHQYEDVEKAYNLQLLHGITCLDAIEYAVANPKNDEVRSTKELCDQVDSVYYTAVRPLIPKAKVGGLVGGIMNLFSKK